MGTQDIRGSRYPWPLLLLAIVVMTLARTHEAQAGMAAPEEPNGLIKLTMSGEYVPSPWTAEYGHYNRAMGKFGYGLKNLCFGWLDLLLEPTEAASNDVSLVRGIGYGVKDSAQNMFGGFVHLMTFPITRLDLMLPEDGVHWRG